MSSPEPEVPPESSPPPPDSGPGPRVEPRRRRGWWLAGAVALLLVAGAVWWHLGSLRVTRPVFQIAFLARGYDARADEAQKTRAKQFEDFHRGTLQRLIDEHNAGDHPFQLELRYVLEPRSTLAQRYRALKTRRNLVAVFDNSWGKDINDTDDPESLAALRAFPLPVVFLNADHNGVSFGEQHAEQARYFLGNSDPVPNEITALLGRLLDQDLADERRMADFLFVAESEYPLTKPFTATLAANVRATLYRPEDTLKLKDRPANRLDILSARADIVAHFLRLAGAAPAGTAEPGNRPPVSPRSNGEWAAMQARRKLIVINGHAAWGEMLVPWIDETFENTTVVGYQSLLSGLPGFRFGRKGNELYLLSDSPQSRAGELQRRFASEIEYSQRTNGMLFVRRCVLAMELCRTALQRVCRGGDGTDGPLADFRRRICHEWSEFRHEKLDTEFGSFRFNRKSGEQLNQNHFLLYLGDELITSPYQLSYDPQGGMPQAIAGVQVGVSEVSVRDVDIDAGTFHADFDYWSRRAEYEPRKGEPVAPGKPDPEAPRSPPGAAAPAATAAKGPAKEPEVDLPNGPRPVLEPIAFKPDSSAATLENFHHQLWYTDSFGPLKQRQYHVSGVFRTPMNGFFYPFDRHRLRIELRAVKPDNAMRVSRGGDTEANVRLQVDGWGLVRHAFTVNASEANVPMDPIAKSRTQYETVVLEFEVRRNWWSQLLLIVVPLGLMAAASLKVLDINFGAEPGTKAHELQVELSLGCMLAVVTYLVSYATLAPRLGTPIWSDVLVGFTLLVVVANFVFLVAYSKDESTRFQKWLQPARYRRIAWLTVWLFTLGWVGIGLWHTYYGVPMRA